MYLRAELGLVFEHLGVDGGVIDQPRRAEDLRERHDALAVEFVAMPVGLKSQTVTLSIEVHVTPPLLALVQSS